MTEENEKDYRINIICRFCEKEKKLILIILVII